MGIKQRHFIEDWKGKRVGTLTVTGQVTKGHKGKTLWEAVCDCGSVSYVCPSWFTNGHAKMCRSCSYKSLSGSGAFRYKGSEHIPGSILNDVKQSAKKRTRYIPVEITIDDLEDQWIKQEGICPYTGLKLIVRRSKEGDASVDRIDSSLGYVRGNIQFVHKRVNIMKNNMSEEEFLFMCKLITEHTSKDKGVCS